MIAAAITYNVIETIAALTAGTIASSTALIGFGLDSVTEVCAAAVAWQFSARHHPVREAREHRTLRIMNISLQASLTTARGAHTGQAIDKRGQRWTGHWREGWPPAC